MENYSFKSVTFGGFDKQDVVRYIEQASEKAAAVQKQLKDERAELQKQLEEQVRKTEELQAQVKTLTEQRDSLQTELDLERSAKQKLEPLQAMEEEAARLKAEVETLRPDAKAYAQFRERLGSIECEARKRADDLEMASAEQMRRTVDSFRTQYQSLMETFGSAAIHVLGELRKLEVDLTQLPLAMDKAGKELEQLSARLEKTPESAGGVIPPEAGASGPEAV